MANFSEIIKQYVGEDGSVPASAIEKLEAAIKTAVGNEFVDKARYKTKLDEIETLKEEKQTAEDGKTTAEKWKTKYEALKGDFDTYKSTVAAEKDKAVKADAYRKLLKEAGISEKRLDAVLKVSDIEKIELLEDGKIKDAENLTKNIKSEWADFIVVEGRQGANTATPPGADGGKNYAEMSDDEYYRTVLNKK